MLALVGVTCGDDDAGTSDDATSAATAPTSTSASSNATSTTQAPATSTTDPATTAGPATTDPPATTAATTTGPGDSSTGAPPDDGVLEFAVIGDFGDDFLVNLGLGGEDLVANLVDTWDPDFVVTVGDNNYPDGLASTIDNNIGKYYAQYIGDYTGAFGPGSTDNRFWPTLGNHDWESGSVQAHYDYFTLPGNERYYDVDYGLVHLFMVDSESEEPDGATFDSVQGQWLQQTMAASDACYKLVFFHRAAYSSGDHGSSAGMQWPFGEWGADAVIAGHDHTYERMTVGGIPYFVNGLGGSLPYPEFNEIPESELFFNTNYGAQLVTVTETDITFDFTDVGGTLIDSLTIEKECGGR